MNRSAIVLGIALACCSCTPQPLTSEVVGLPETAAYKQKVSFRVRVHNRSKKTQILPAPHEVKLSTSFGFMPYVTPGKLLSKQRSSGELIIGDQAITRNVINFCPPQFDHLEAGGSREYQFQWTPDSDDPGRTGAFRIELPSGIPEIPLQPMTVVSEKEG